MADRRKTPRVVTALDSSSSSDRARELHRADRQTHRDIEQYSQQVGSTDQQNSSRVASCTSSARGGKFLPDRLIGANFPHVKCSYSSHWFLILGQRFVTPYDLIEID